MAGMLSEVFLAGPAFHPGLWPQIFSSEKRRKNYAGLHTK